MKRSFLVALLAMAGLPDASAATIAPPVIQWQSSFGGTNWENDAIIRETPDGGYIVGCYSDSPPSGNKTSELFGNLDFWLVRLDSAGNKLWEGSYGGSGYDVLGDVRVTADGGFLLAGRSSSPTNADKTGMDFGNGDAWLVRLDPDGNKLWDKTYGGTGQDTAIAVMQMEDGGFVVAGDSWSVPSGNKSSTNFGSYDVWVFRIDADGNLLWDRSFGGSSGDAGRAVCQSANGNIMICAESMSPANGNKTSPNLGGLDYWLIALDAAGNKLWERTYGGSSPDAAMKFTSLADGGFVLAGVSSSSPGSTKDSPCYGPCNYQGWPSGDFWIVRTDSLGNRLADLSFGSINDDIVWDMIATSDGGIILCGNSPTGLSGNKTVPGFGAGDGWLVRLDSNLSKVWEMALGGTQGDTARSIRQTRDGGFIVGASSSSGVGGNKTTSAIGAIDLWIVKFGPDALTAPQLRAQAQSAEQIRTLGFRMELLPPVNAPTNAVYTLEASTNRESWTAIQTNRLPAASASIEFIDADATNLPARYYRARMER